MMSLVTMKAFLSHKFFLVFIAMFVIGLADLVACGCDEKYRVPTGETVVVTSPGYPNNFTGQIHCFYELATTFNSGDVIHLRVEEINLRCNDTETTLEVYDAFRINPYYLGRVCKGGQDFFVSPKDMLYLILWAKSNATMHAGFKFSAKAVPEFAHCYQQQTKVLTATSDAQHFTTPHYPLQIPPLVSCKWLLKTTPGHNIFLEVTHADMSGSNDCKNFGLEVYDGKTMYDDDKLGSVCDNKRQVFHSSSHFLFVLFTSGETTLFTGGGLRLKYYSYTFEPVKASEDFKLLYILLGLLISLVIFTLVLIVFRVFILPRRARQFPRLSRPSWTPPEHGFIPSEPPPPYHPADDTTMNNSNNSHHNHHHHHHHTTGHYNINTLRRDKSLFARFLNSCCACLCQQKGQGHNLQNPPQSQAISAVSNDYVLGNLPRVYDPHETGDLSEEQRYSTSSLTQLLTTGCLLYSDIQRELNQRDIHLESMTSTTGSDDYQELPDFSTLGSRRNGSTHRNRPRFYTFDQETEISNNHENESRTSDDQQRSQNSISETETESRSEVTEESQQVPLNDADNSCAEHVQPVLSDADRLQPEVSASRSSSQNIEQSIPGASQTERGGNSETGGETPDRQIGFVNPAFDSSDETIVRNERKKKRKEDRAPTLPRSRPPPLSKAKQVNNVREKEDEPISDDNPGARGGVKNSEIPNVISTRENSNFTERALATVLATLYDPSLSNNLTRERTQGTNTPSSQPRSELEDPNNITALRVNGSNNDGQDSNASSIGNSSRPLRQNNQKRFVHSAPKGALTTEQNTDADNIRDDIAEYQSKDSVSHIDTASARNNTHSLSAGTSYSGDCENNDHTRLDESVSVDSAGYQIVDSRLDGSVRVRLNPSLRNGPVNITGNFRDARNQNGNKVSMTQSVIKNVEPTLRNDLRNVKGNICDRSSAQEREDNKRTAQKQTVHKEILISPINQTGNKVSQTHSARKTTNSTPPTNLAPNNLAKGQSSDPAKVTSLRVSTDDQGYEIPLPITTAGTLYDTPHAQGDGDHKYERLSTQ